MRMMSRLLIVFALFAGCGEDARPGTYPGDVRGMGWNRAEGEEVVLHDFHSSPRIDLFDDLVGDLRRDISTRLGVLDTMPRPELFLVDSRDELRRVTGISAMGVALSQHHALVAVDSGRAPNLLLLRHELTHLFSAALLPPVDTPVPWVSEGLATWVTPKCAGHSYRAVGIAILEAGQLPTRAQLENNFYGLDDFPSYAAAASLVDFVVDRWGENSIPVLWQGSLDSIEAWAGEPDVYAAWVDYLQNTPAQARTLGDLTKLRSCAMRR